MFSHFYSYIYLFILDTIVLGTDCCLAAQCTATEQTCGSGGKCECDTGFCDTNGATAAGTCQVDTGGVCACDTGFCDTNGATAGGTCEDETGVVCPCDVGFCDTNGATSGGTCVAEAGK
jgi:hypothetical protein